MRLPFNYTFGLSQIVQGYPVCKGVRRNPLSEADVVPYRSACGVLFLRWISMFVSVYNFIISELLPLCGVLFSTLESPFCFCVEFQNFRITSSPWCRPPILLTTHHPLMPTTAHFPSFDGGRLPLFCKLSIGPTSFASTWEWSCSVAMITQDTVLPSLYLNLIWQRVSVWLEIHHGSLWGRISND